MATYRGSCLCGGVEFEVSGDPLFVGICHCTFCRADHGADSVHQAGFPAPQVKFIKGQDDVIQFRHPSHGDKAPTRASCKTCGGKAYNVIMGGKGFGFPATAFTTGGRPLPPLFAAKQHVNYANRISDAHDELPKFLDFPAPFGGSGKAAFEPVARMKEVYAHFGKHEIDAIAGFCADDVTWTVAGGPGPHKALFNAVYKGPSGVKDLFRHVGQHTKLTSFKPERFIHDGDIVVVQGTATGAKFGLHHEATWNFTHIARFHDEKIVEFHDQWTPSTADAAKIYA
jgi:ketosteroid isomerase-like protein